jgi:DnaK suppressor protein
MGYNAAKIVRKGVSVMTPEEKRAFKESIEREIATLSEEIERLQASLYPERGEGPSDKVAHISFKQDQQVHIQRYNEAVKRLNRLKEAYARIDTPEYGICRECEEPIPLARLCLAPESLYCVACMEELGL